MRLVITVAAAVIAGCLGQPLADPAQDAEAEGATYTRLLASSAFVNHAGAGNVRTVPEEPALQPTLCVLYRNGVYYGEDTCRVIEGPPAYQEEIEVPWHIEGRWKASDAGADDTMQRLEEKTITAYHSEHDVVARWNGTDRHSQFRMAIE